MARRGKRSAPVVDAVRDAAGDGGAAVKRGAGAAVAQAERTAGAAVAQVERGADAAAGRIERGAVRTGLRKPPRATTGRRALALGIAATTAGAAWGASYLTERRRIAADPRAAELDRPLAGRPVPVTAGDGTVLRVRVFGPDDAPTVVLVHGWTCALEFWTLQIQALAGELRLVAYDLRGHGGSAPSGGGDYSIQAYDDDLDAVLRATVPEGERAVLVGHSLGAMTIVAWAQERPDQVDARVSAVGLFSTGVGDLITSSLILPAPGVGKRVQQEIAQAFLGSSAPIPHHASPVTSRVVRYVALCGAASPATVAFCTQMVLACPRDVRANTGSTLSTLDLYEGVEALTVPTTVLVGRSDRLTPPVHAGRMAADLPQLLEMIELPDVGHMAPLEAPERTNQAIRDLVAAGRDAAPAVADGDDEAPVSGARRRTRAARPGPRSAA